MTNLSIDELCAQLRRVWLNDPDFEAMDNGSVAWGDIVPLETTESEFWTPVQDTDSEDSTPQPIHPPAPLWKYPVPTKTKTKTESWERVDAEKVVRKLEFTEERHVPSFTPGIKTIIARNLPRDITTDAVKFSFAKYGPIRDVYIPKNMDKNSPHYGTVKGFALIKFQSAADSASAFTHEFGLLKINGQKIFIEFAKEDR